MPRLRGYRRPTLEYNTLVTGVHPLRGRLRRPIWLAQGRHAPEVSGPLLLLHWGRERLRTSYRREPLPRVHLRGHHDRYILGRVGELFGVEAMRRQREKTLTNL